MENNTQPSTVVIILRWIFFLPIAALAAIIALFLVTYINRVTMKPDPDSFIPKAFITFASHASMGGAFVYVCGKIVPFYKKTVAYILAVIGFVLAGFLLFPSIMTENYWATWGVVSIIIGLGMITRSVSIGETEL